MQDGATATMIASEKGCDGCLRLLIAAGASLEHQDKVKYGFAPAFVCD